MIDPRLMLVQKRLERVGRVVYFGSGKGGVGKSMISASTAILLKERGYRVGYLDLDMHGPACPLLFPLDGRVMGGKEGIETPVSRGIKVMSVGLFLKSQPFPLEGKHKPDLLLDLLSSVRWEELDYLIVDLPPGMGDELSFTIKIFGQKASLVLVTTASNHSVGVVQRLAAYARAEKLRILGIIVNMSKLNKVRIFGGLEPEEVAVRLGVNLLGEVSFYPQLGNASDIYIALKDISEFRDEVERFVNKLVREA